MFGLMFHNPRLIVTAMTLAAGLGGQVSACDDNPDKNAAYEKHYPEISYSELRGAIDGGEIYIIDANSTETYRKGHLPGAHSLGNEDSMPKLKIYPIAVYCGGPQCAAWHKAADYATARGYSNVVHYKGGIKGWKENGDKLATGISP